MLALVVGVALLAPRPLAGQSFFGSIVGTVSDSSGAIVSGATVTITNTATNEKRTAQTNAAGDFSFVSLVPSSYSVEVQKSSFKRFLLDQVTVQVNATVRVDAPLQVGETTETVEVSTQAPLLQTDSGTMGSVIEGKSVEEMPLNGRNTMNLLSLAAGVIPTNNAGGGAALGSGGHTTTSNWSGYSIGGGLVGYSAMFVDGAPLNILGGATGAIGFIPTQDAVQEFNVVTNASTSEFGRYSGGVVNMTTKSGGNKLHGSAYEYVRNQLLNANEWFNKRTQVLAGKANKPLQWNQNQYGVTVTGPIKKDKLFFLGSWEAYSNRQSGLQTRAVPTQDMIDGIIYQPTAAAANAMIAYINGLAGNSNGLTAKTNCASLASGSTNKVQIAKSCWDGSSKVMMTEWPKYTNTTSSNNFEKLSGTGADKKDYIGRVDYNLSSNQRLFARFVKSDLDDMPQEWMPGGVDPSGKTWHVSGGTTINHALNGVIGDTITINPTTILDLRLSSMRVYNDQHTPTTGMDLGIFGSNWGTLQSAMTKSNIPMVNVSEAGSTCSPTTGKTLCSPQAFLNSGQISFQWNDTQSFGFSLTKMMGAHNLKMGGETRYMDRYMINLGGNLSASGNFAFNNAHFTGSGWANFLLGMPSNVTQNNVRKVASYNWYQGYYINDTWQATRKLTITAGVRWELPGNVKEKRDNAVVLAPGGSYTDSSSNKFFGTAYLVNSTNYGDRGSTPARYGLFAPNMGFAFRLTDSDVIRGGFGMSFAPPDIQTGIFPESSSMNSSANTWDSSGVYAAVYPLSNPFPGGLTSPVSRSAFSAGTFLSKSIIAPLPTSKVPFTQQWNLSVSHQFKGDMMIEVGYAGSSAKNLPTTFVMNELEPRFWADPTMPTTPSANCGPWTAAKTTVGQCSRPYSSYLTFNDAIGPYGWTNYHALPVKFQKRFGAGGLLNASFTWTKSLGNTGGGMGNPQSPGGAIQNWYDLKSEKSVTAFSLPRRLVVSYIYNLPFGKGQKFLNGITNPVASRLISGWALNGIATYQSGFPVTIAANAAAGTENIPVKYGSGALRANYRPGCNKMAGGSWRDHVMAGTAVINTDCWTAPPVTYTIGAKGYSTTMGNAPRLDSDVRAPGYNNWDLSLQKRTGITEKIFLDFRAEYFNAFNHERFGMPNSTLNANNFGLITGGGAGQSQARLGQLSLRLNF